MSTSLMSQPIPRVDGKLKVTGQAKYAADNAIQNVAYGISVAGTIAARMASPHQGANQFSALF